MSRSIKTNSQLQKVDKARETKIYQADTLLQKGRFELTLTEQRLILYAISKIKSTDTKFQEYTLRIKDFYDICGITELDSYTAIKKILLGLRKKLWWILMDDPNNPGKECESLVSWFEIARTYKKSGLFTIAFHPDMMPYLLELARQREDGGGFYTQFTFCYVLPMRSQYAIRLYELLKSYQKNNTEWWFKVEDMKRLLNCQHYKGFKDFRVNVLEPAVKEINKFSDINIRYETEKEGKRIDVVTFNMGEKTVPERIEAQKAGLTVLDGKIHYWDSDVLPGQTTLFEEEMPIHQRDCDWR
jgi:plasmid replication initiation protein